MRSVTLDFREPGETQNIQHFNSLITANPHHARWSTLCLSCDKTALLCDVTLP